MCRDLSNEYGMLNFHTAPSRMVVSSNAHSQEFRCLKAEFSGDDGVLVVWPEAWTFRVSASLVD